MAWMVVARRVGADSQGLQRLIGDRSYKSMWRRYKYRVMIAMSAQAFAQLVRPARSQPGVRADLGHLAERD